MCRFYGFSFNDVMNFTVRQFTIFLLQISEILKMESGSSVSEPRVYSGEAAHRLGMQMFRRGKK